MKKIIFMIIVLMCLSLFITGDEGMWLLTQIKNLDLHQKGLKIDLAKIYDPSNPSIVNAIVQLGGGTAELVSPNGLLLTNHHVAFGAVQGASARLKETDLIASGFLAKTYEEEIEAPGYSAQVLQSMEDVTAKFTRFDKIADIEKRQKEIDREIKQMTNQIEKGKTDIVAEIVAMYEGKQYIQFVHKRFDDIRVVYVPPASVGNYGGEIDNWMWPRHCADFSFMRVYMAPDGSGRKYNKENVPYKSKYWLKASNDSIKEGDFTFIIGYPGNTTRYRNSDSVEYNFSFQYPTNIKLFGEIITLLESFEKDSIEAKMKVANLIKGLANTMKNMQGKVDGMKSSNFLQKKLDFEKDMMAFLQKDAKLMQKYGTIFDETKKLYDKQKQIRERDNILGLFGGLSGNMISIAQNIYYTVKEREKPLKDRDPYFSEQDIERTVSRLEYVYLSYYEPADKALFKKSLTAAAQLPENTPIKGLAPILNDKTKTIDQYINEAYKNSKLNDVELAKSLFKKSSKELDALNDPFLILAKNLYPENEESKKTNEEFMARISDLRKKYIDAIYAWKGSSLYPDANSTIRFTYGDVAGYSPRDAVSYNYITTLKGVMEKETGEDPFIVPAALKELYQKKDYGIWKDATLNDVPVAFTHKCDITGGNSGSPVMNAKGELIGIAFDGNYEAMTGDWQYDEKLQRTISVDIRYVLFITEKLSNANFILKEMGIQ